jgi:hypothetical protein
VTDESSETTRQINPIELSQFLRAFTMLLYEKDLITTGDKDWLFEQIGEVIDDA